MKRIQRPWPGVRVLVGLLAYLFVSSAPAQARSLRSWRPAKKAATPAPSPGTRIAIQPIGGNIGPALRGQLARLLQQKGFRVLMSVPAASGTSQYPGMARDNRLAAFVVTDVTERGHGVNATFLVWHSDGSVTDRWTVWASDKRLWKTVAKGFWQHLGKALSECKAPPSEELGPAPPMRIDAGDPLDEPIVTGDGWSRQKAPILR
jgi:hypothetical protein